MKPLHVRYLGNFVPQHSTETHVAAALESLGHTVERIQEGSVRAVNVPDATEHTPDLFLHTQTYPLAEQGGTITERRQMLDTFATRSIPTVAYHLDRYFDTLREGQISTEPWWRSDLVCSADGGNQSRFHDLGINHHWIRPAMYGPESVIARQNSSYRCDVAFVGSVATYHEEWPWRKELIVWLANTYGTRFQLWPNRRHRSVRGLALNSLYSSAKVVVGDSMFAGTDKGANYWSDRLYETPGRGGVMVFPWTEGIDDQFTTDEMTYYTMGDFDNLKESIDNLLADDARRAALRQNGMARVQAEHTYTHRCEEIIRLARSQFPTLVGWKGSVTSKADLDVVREIYVEDVYRAADKCSGTVLDLGANIGVFSTFAIDNGAERVIAVEPTGSNFRQLCENVRFTDKTVVLLPVAVMGKALRVTMKDKGGEPVASPDPAGAVEAVPLNDLISTYGPVSFLKCDIEGAEWQVFEGASSAALDQCAHISIEFHGTHTPTALTQPPGALGRLVEKLSHTHHVEVLGSVDRGGFVYATRYGS